MRPVQPETDTDRDWWAGFSGGTFALTAGAEPRVDIFLGGLLFKVYIRQLEVLEDTTQKLHRGVTKVLSGFSPMPPEIPAN